MEHILQKKLEKDKDVLEGMTLWQRIVNMMKEERNKYSRKCEIEKDDTRHSQGVLFGLDIFLGRMDDNIVKRKSMLDKACE